MFVSSNYFRTIGVALARGPGFVTPDTTDPVVILGHTFWQKRAAADPDIVGKTLTVDGVAHIVAGIAPEAFSGHLTQHDAELFLPLARHPNLLGAKSARFDRGKPVVNIHGRLSPGVSVAQASAAVAAFTSQLAKEYPATNETRAGIVEPYYPAGSLANTESKILYAILNAVASVPLLVVCLNVFSMVQVRSALRERELSIRLALGASRRRLVRHLLAEAVILAALGGTLASIALPGQAPGPIIGPGGHLGAAGRGLLEINFASAGAVILTISVLVAGLLLWTDYFRPEHAEKYPNLHDLVWKTCKLTSTVKQQINKQAALDLLAGIQQIAEIFWETKGVKTTRRPSGQPTGGEIVSPA